MKKLFLLGENEIKYSGNNQGKIELINCPHQKEGCEERLSVINQYFLVSHKYHYNKEYTRSIEALKLAFDLTFEIQESSCLNCAEQFRTTIISSLENIHSDLQKMSIGWFKATRFQSSLEQVTLVLEECKNKN